MNITETLELLKALNAYGAKHFKSGDFEVTLGNVPRGTIPEVLPPDLGSKSAGDTAQPANPANPANIANPDATERLKDLIGSLKMNDAELFDKIFPAGAGG